MKQLFYKSDYVQSISGGKYYFYYFTICDSDGNKVDHYLNDTIGSATFAQVHRAQTIAEKRCEELSIERYNVRGE